MLPTTGYFKHINCPFYDSGLCERPYCHFRHGKKGEIAEMALGVVQPVPVEKPPQVEQNNVDEDVLKHLVSETVKKVLSHAEILSGAIVSDSVNSLVSKVVEELKPGSSVNAEPAPPSTAPATSHRLYLPPAGTPSYKPTPIAQLKRHVPVPYIPSSPCRIKRKPINNSCMKSTSDHEKSKANFSIFNKEYVYKPSSCSKKEESTLVLEVPQKENSEEEQEEETEGDKDEEMETEDISESANVNVSNSISSVEVDGVDVTNELDMLNDILIESDSKLPKEEEEDEEEEREMEEDNHSKSVVKKNKESGKVKDKSEKVNYKKSESDKVKNKKSESDNLKDKKTEGDKVKDKKSESDKVKGKKSESDKVKDKKSETDKVKDKKSESDKLKDKKSESDKRRHSRSSSRSHSESNSSSHKNKENEKHRSRSKHSSHKRSHSESSRPGHKRSSSSHKSSAHSKSSHKHSHHSDKNKVSHSSSSSNHKSHSSNKNSKSSSSRKSSRRSSDDSSKSKRSKKEDSHTEEISSSEDDTGHESDKAASITFPSPTLDDVDLSESDEDTVMQECRRIFEEYKPEPKQEVPAPKKSSWTEEFNDEDEVRKKKRVAHEGARSLLPLHVAPKRKTVNPVQAMTQRLLKIKEVQEQKKARLLKQATAPAFSQAMMERIARIKELKRLSFDEPKPVQPSSSKTVPPAGYSATSGVKIASVQNVQLLLNAKNRMQAQMEIRTKKENSAISNSTIAQTAKGGQRVAHVPSQKVLVHPVITNEGGGKFPANFRQKHLDHLVQQYIKLTGDEEYSMAKGKETENEICERATSRMVYSSIMATTINKIRKECEIKAGERSATKDLSIVTGSNSKGSWSMRKGAKETESGFSLSRIYQLLLPYVMSQEDLVINGYPRPHPEERGMAIITPNSAFRNKICNPNSMLRTCGRCGKSYTVNKHGLQIKEEQCVYHWGHLIQTRAHGGWERHYTCCSGDSEGVGCCVAQCHVSDGFNPDELRGYVKTLPVDKEPDDGNHGVYALDCEMCYTTSGLELTRVTVVDSSLNTVYETLVKPSNPIIDFNTRFSGITEEDMKGVTTSIFDVQATLLSIVHEKTILIGHSLESDFKALKIIHDTVVDTSVVFPHRMGPPKKRALKNLCRDYLKKIIQESVNGHDSAEDAKACMELMIWKLQNQAA